MYEEDDSSTVFRDFSLAVAAIFVCLVIIILPFINPPGEDGKKEIEPPGSIMIESIWPADNNVDVDTWVLGPDEVKVGYNNKAGKIFNLLRDDTGLVDDVTNLNYENIFSRGIHPGWYVVNLQLFGINGGEVPVIVRVVLSYKKNPRVSTVQFYATDIELRKQKEEITVLRFFIDDTLQIKPDSFSTIFQPIVITEPGAG